MTDRDDLYPPGSLAGARRPGLTGSSYDDLPRMAAWCRDNPAQGHVDRGRAFRHDPGPVDGYAQPAMAPSEDVGRLVDRRSHVEDAMRTCMAGLELLLGPGVGASVRQVYAEVQAAAAAVEGWQIRRGDQLEGTVAHMREIIDSRDRDVDRARNLAASLEEELARLSDPWVGRYLEALEAAVGDERDTIVAAVTASVGSPAPAPEPFPLVDPGLPIVDDAGLPEGQMAFRRGDTLLATGHLARVFGPLDQATEIAVGAVPYDAPQTDDAEVAEAIDRAFADDDDSSATVVVGELVTWPDGTQWRWTGSDGWCLAATSQPDGVVNVAPPVSDRSVGTRAVHVGGMWGPFGDPPEVPRAQPPGPPTPPRPPHHNPIA